MTSRNSKICSSGGFSISTKYSLEFSHSRKDSKNLSVPKGFSKHPVLVCDFNDRSLYILVGEFPEELNCNQIIILSN